MNMRTYDFTSRYGTHYEIAFEKAAYVFDGSVAVEVWCKEDGEEYWEPYCSLTTNLSDFAGDDKTAYLDTNNTPDICKFVLDKGWAKEIGTGRSGFCEYPLVVFSDEFLSDVCAVSS